MSALSVHSGCGRQNKKVTPPQITKKAVTVHLKCKQLLHFGFPWKYETVITSHRALVSRQIENYLNYPMSIFILTVCCVSDRDFL